MSSNAMPPMGVPGVPGSTYCALYFYLFSLSLLSDELGARCNGPHPAHPARADRSGGRDSSDHPAHRPHRSVIGSRVSATVGVHIRSVRARIRVPHSSRPILSDAPSRTRLAGLPARLFGVHNHPPFGCDNHHRLITGRGWGKKHLTRLQDHPSRNTAGTTSPRDAALTESAR